jgi:hypothetical protein
MREEAAARSPRLFVEVEKDKGHQTGSSRLTQ